MGLFDSDFSFGGSPRFDGEMTSSGSGARIRAGVKGLPIIGDVNVVDVQVPGFAKGGVIPGRGPSRGQAVEARAGRRGQTLRPTTSGARESSAGRRRQGGANAPTRHGGAASAVHAHRGEGGKLVNPVAAAAAGTGGLRRRRHEIAPGIPCPSCAAGVTKPVR